MIRAAGRATRRYGLAPALAGDRATARNAAGPPVRAFVAEAEVALIRKDGRLEGAELWFRDGGPQVSEAIAREFDIGDLGGQEPYQMWGSGEAVRYTREGPGGSRLVVAGPSFGKAFAAYP